MYWDPFEEIKKMQADMERFFHVVKHHDHPLLAKGEQGELMAYRTPLADLRETENNVLATFEIPGAKKEDIDLNISERKIELTVENKQKEQINKNGESFYYQRAHCFARSFLLPKPVNPDNAKATYENGILRIEIPKKEQTNGKGKHIRIE